MEKKDNFDNTGSHVGIDKMVGINSSAGKFDIITSLVHTLWDKLLDYFSAFAQTVKLIAFFSLFNLIYFSISYFRQTILRIITIVIEKRNEILVVE